MNCSHRTSRKTPAPHWPPRGRTKVRHRNCQSRRQHRRHHSRGPADGPRGGPSGDRGDFAARSHRTDRNRHSDDDDAVRIANDTERDFFMSAVEAKEYGLIDLVISRPELPDPTVPVTSL